MWTVIGHDREVSALSRALASGSLTHAVLLTGPAGTGKTHLALELAKALNCTGDDPPCGMCKDCRQIAAISHPDVTVIERLDGKDSIAIQQVRELRDAASLRPFQGKKKVYIIAGAEALTPQAADALLKTLEEPQPQVVLILTATDLESLPATVASRCRLLRLHQAPTADLEVALEKRGLSLDDARRLSRLAQGNVGWALRAAEQPKLSAQHQGMVTQLVAAPDLPLDERLQLAELVTAERKDRSTIRRNLEILLLLGRDLMLLSQGGEPKLVGPEEREILAGQAGRWTPSQIHTYLQQIRLAMRRIDQNVDPRLAVEALLVGLP